MNLANKLTVSRICIIPLFVLFMGLGELYSSVLALIIFSSASITDFFDGQMARKNKTITYFGIFFDPLVDKILISSAFICFANIPILGIPSWMIIAIISREFLITGLRSIVAVKNIIVSTNKLGKFKTTLQICVAITILIILIINRTFYKFVSVKSSSITKFDNYYCATLAIIEKIPFWITLVVVVVTIYSGINYILEYKKLLNE
jgi:CDP-diacylglycerol--glycerol-3-phosphate 3-phosphatidyltransferase